MDFNGNLEISEGNGRTGLINLGNTCFMNAVIQCLSHTDPLRQYFLSNQMENDLNSSTQDSKQGMTAYLLGLLLRQMWSNKFNSLRPTKLKTMITSLSDNFFGGGQQDAHELLTYLLVRIHSDLNRIRTKPNSNLNIDEELEECLEVVADRYWERFKACNDSIIVDLFFFQPLSSVKCDFCSKTSYNLGEDCYISVPIIEERRQIDLYDCLDNYFSEEYLRDGNEWYCPMCKRKRNATKTYGLWSLPSIGIIQLKRFGFDDNYCLRKITTEVNFPINNLDLSQYCIRSNKKTTYNLYAVVNHMGSLSNGHYIALAKSKNSVWRRFDDNYIEDIKESEVKSRSAYILFYKKN